MASRIMHPAVAARLLPELPLTMDVSRFLTGSLLPDVSARRDASHLLIRDGNLRTNDLPRFRYGPYEVHDVVADSPDLLQRREEILAAVHQENPGSTVQRFMGRPIE